MKKWYMEKKCACDKKCVCDIKLAHFWREAKISCAETRTEKKRVLWYVEKNLCVWQQVKSLHTFDEEQKYLVTEKQTQKYACAKYAFKNCVTSACENCVTKVHESEAPSRANLTKWSVSDVEFLIFLSMFERKKSDFLEIEEEFREKNLNFFLFGILEIYKFISKNSISNIYLLSL